MQLMYYTRNDDESFCIMNHYMYTRHDLISSFIPTSTKRSWSGGLRTPYHSASAPGAVKMISLFFNVLDLGFFPKRSTTNGLLEFNVLEFPNTLNQHLLFRQDNFVKIRVKAIFTKYHKRLTILRCLVNTTGSNYKIRTGFFPSTYQQWEVGVCQSNQHHNANTTYL